MKNLGWNVPGVERDPEVAALAQHSGLPGCTKPFEGANIPDESMDPIAMNQVIQHVYDPIAVMEKCHRIPKPGGIGILNTPNVGSLGHRPFQGRWQSRASTTPIPRSSCQHAHAPGEERPRLQ